LVTLLRSKRPFRYTHSQPGQVPRRLITRTQQLYVNVLYPHSVKLRLHSNYNIPLQHQPTQRPLVQRLTVRPTANANGRQRRTATLQVGLEQPDHLIRHNHRPLYPRHQLTRARQPTTIPRQPQCLE
jgi:hypothetical protein